MHPIRTLVVILGLGVVLPETPQAQVPGSPATFGVVAGDSVRIWSRPPESFTGFPSRVARFTSDSLALTSGTVLHLSSLIQLEVRRRVRVHGGGGSIASGATLGLLLGAVVGGVIGSAASRPSHGEEGGYGALVGIPAGALVGAAVGGAFGARERTVTQWVQVPLGGR
jgi:hypothetical protein